MQYTRPDYFSDFTCIADRCPDTCCAGWNIMIDDEMLESYSRVEGEFGNRLKNSIDWRQGCFYQYARRCAFLNDENYCDIYKEMGEGMLCETCREFPRHTEEFEDVREISLSLACPEAARIILSRKDKVGFITEETDEWEEYEDFDYLLYGQLVEVREAIFELLQNRNLPLEKRAAILKRVGEEIQHYLEEGDYSGIDQQILQGKEGKWKDIFHGEPASLRDRYDSMKSSFAQLRKLEPLNEHWPAYLKHAVKFLYGQGYEEYEKMYGEFQLKYGSESPNQEVWNIYGEQLLVYFVFIYFCGGVYDDRIVSKVNMAVYSMMWIQELWMAAWKENKGNLDLEELCQIAWRYSKEVEHSDENLEAVEEIAAQL